MRIFAADRISGIMQRLGMEEGVPIESRFVSKQIENAQKRVEGQNFAYRKHVLEYDDVMNKQREAVYGLRQSAAGRRGPEGISDGHRRRHHDRSRQRGTQLRTFIRTNGI